jgi:hypothetical protein
MSATKNARKALYNDRALVEGHLREHSVDPDDASTWHRLRRSRKDEIGKALSEKTGVDAGYCDWVIADYFGQKTAEQR